MAAGESHLVAGFGRRLFPVRSGATLSSSSATTSAIWSANSSAVVAGDVKIALKQMKCERNYQSFRDKMAFG